MVEILIKRGELLPSDESIQQHQKKRAEEVGDVDKDRNGSEGLFKGMFPVAKRELIFDDGDGVYRCPRCLTEHEGGPTCSNCDLAVELGYDLSDMDDFDPEDLESLEVDLDDDLDIRADYHFGNIHRPFHNHAHHFHHPLHHHHHHYHLHEDDSEDSGSVSSELDREEDEPDEDDSLQDFVVADEDPRLLSERGVNRTNEREPVNISDDDSDEGGAISNRRRRRIAHHNISSGSSSTSTPPRTSASSVGVSEDEDTMLQRAGWSPLEQENDSDLEGSSHYPPYANRDQHSNESDTETIGNDASDDDSDRSGTPRYEYPPYGAEYSDGEEDEISDVEAGMDHDGDTEMSVSPSAGHGRSISVSTDGYEYDSSLDPQSRGGSMIDDPYGIGPMSHRSVSIDPENCGPGAQNLGEANEIHEIDGDSSDNSIVAAPRRQRRQNAHIGRAQPYYDPRISMIFAEHQQMRGAQDPHTSLAQLDDQMRRAPTVEPASRARRMYAYRGQPQRRIDPLRSSRSPSATRIISSSNRTARLPPQYHRRN